jgi:superfamily I DNA and/or RNA helicase
MNDLGLCHPGPGDPRDRLIFIKRVVWGLIHKYIPKRETVQWKYFETNFRYIVETRSQLGKRLKMVRGYIQVPGNGDNITLKTLYFRDDIDASWTVKKIVDWAAKST